MTLAKKITIISGSLFLALLFLWGIYKFAFEAKTQFAAPISTPTPTINPTETTKPEEKVYAISDGAVLSPTLTQDGQAIKYYTPDTGHVFQVDLNGANKKTLSDKTLFGLTNVLWSPDKSKVISNFFVDGKTSFSLFDYAENKAGQLPQNINDIAWLNDTRILYFYFNRETGMKNISIANPDGTDWKKITTIDKERIFFTPVPKTSLVSFWNFPDAYNESALNTSSLLGDENKQTITSGKFGADYLWSPDGSKVLMSYVNEKGGSQIQLGIANASGGEFKNLDIPTLVSKCVWSQDNQTIFYSLPGLIPATAVMPNDYFSKKLPTADSFWKFDLKTGKKTRLVELTDLKNLNISLDATKLFLDSSETILFFINRTDGKLYRLNIS